MLRGLLHPSEYKEILFQVAQQPNVTYGHERRSSSLARERIRARDTKLREKIKTVKHLADEVNNVRKMTGAIQVLSQASEYGQKSTSKPKTLSDELRRIKLLATVVSAFKGNLKSQKSSDKSKNEVQSTDIMNNISEEIEEQDI